MNNILALMLDFETRSPTDIGDSCRRYVNDPHFGVMCLGMQSIMSGGLGPPHVQSPARQGSCVFERGWDLCPSLIIMCIEMRIPIYAHNLVFDRTVYEEYCVKVLGWPAIPRELWRCTLALCSYYTLPRKLEHALLALRVPIKKDMEGNKLMKKYSKPRAWTKTEIKKAAERGESLAGKYKWWDKPEDLQRIYQYCGNDIVAQSTLLQTLQPMPVERRKEWQFDQQMNERGVPVDVEGLRIVENLLAQSMSSANQQLAQLTAMPGHPEGVVQTVMQRDAIMEWIASQGVHISNLKAETVEQYLSWPDLPANVLAVLRIRSLAGKASIAKVESMLSQVDKDGRVRHGIVWHGAATGRYAGRGVQWHNFPRDCMKEKDAAFFHEVIRNNPYPFEALRERFAPSSEDAPVAFVDILTTALRSFVTRADGLPLYVSDFSSIEARVLAWISGCKLLLSVFERKECPYCQFASIAFNKEVKKGMDERQLGKVAVLGLGYQMGAEKFITTAAGPAYNVRLDQKQSKYIVDLFRDTYVEIPMFWRTVENAMKTAIKTRGVVDVRGMLRFQSNGQWACIRLPSGRCIWYAQPSIIREPSKFKEGQTKEVIQYWCVDPVKRQWVRTTTYGGCITENIVQAIAADLLNAAMYRVDERGYNVILSVHDEVIAEPPSDPRLSFDEFHSLMRQRPDWAADCPIDAESHQMVRYGK